MSDPRDRRPVTLEELITVGATANLRDQDDPCEDESPDWRDRQ